MCAGVCDDYCGGGFSLVEIMVLLVLERELNQLLYQLLSVTRDSNYYS